MTGPTAQEQAALERALDLAATPGVLSGPNPRVGCVLLSAGGEVAGEGFHRGAGNPHAEVEALRSVPPGVKPVTAVVTLEPCRHTGRTPPCVDALIAAGIARVVFAHRDPTPQGGGGGDALRAAGVTVVEAPAVRAAEVLRPWLFGVEHGRPWVTWKVAATLDGRIAARDGSSRWITGAAARADVHELRAAHDVVVVGTGTLLADDPALTVRLPDGRDAPTQPARAVMGLRPIPSDARILTGGPVLALQTRDVGQALATVYEKGMWRVFLEGGGRLAAAFLKAGAVDEIVAYVAPALLGDGTPMVGDLGAGSISDAIRHRLVAVEALPPEDPIDVRVTLRPAKEANVHRNH